MTRVPPNATTNPFGTAVSFENLSWLLIDIMICRKLSRKECSCKSSRWYIIWLPISLMSQFVIQRLVLLEALNIKVWMFWIVELIIWKLAWSNWMRLLAYMVMGKSSNILFCIVLRKSAPTSKPAKMLAIPTARPNWMLASNELILALVPDSDSYLSCFFSRPKSYPFCIFI